MSGLDMQEALALLAVALIVALALWRRHQRRKARRAGCDGCDVPAAAARPLTEATLKFHRRR